ncbi:hypothetical protein GCM10010259_65880 [Streptomyces daghestanicus]|nr:hypothetical protein GCM10010259_65880 [Streptomyces daghestanicus]
MRREVRHRPDTGRYGYGLGVQRLPAPRQLMPHLIQAARAAQHRAARAAASIGAAHPLTRLLLAAAALAVAAAWEAGHRVADLHPTRRHERHAQCLNHRSTSAT